MHRASTRDFTRCDPSVTVEARRPLRLRPPGSFYMGDLRAGMGDTARPSGRRVGRHSVEGASEQPYVGCRVAARPAPAGARRVVQPAPGRRRAETGTFPVSPPSPFAEAPAPGRRALRVD